MVLMGLSTKYPHQHITQLFIFFILSGLMSIGWAQTTDTRSTIVLVSMKGDTRGWFLPKSEERIIEELRLSNFRVVTVNATSVDESGFQNELKTAAKSHGATASLLVYKSQHQSVHLLLHVINQEDASLMYKEFNLPISPTQEETDIFALKAADAVQTVVSNNGPSDANSTGKSQRDLSAQSSRSRPNPKLVAAISLAILGASGLIAGGLLHWKMSDYEDDANEFVKMRNDLVGDCSCHNDEIQEYEKLCNNKRERAKQYQIGATISYVVGGSLTAVAGVVFYSFVRSKTKSRRRLVAYFVPGEAGISWRF